MSVKYHFNATTGQTGECHASVRHCPHGGPEAHGDSPEDATLRHEEAMAHPFNLGNTTVNISPEMLEVYRDQRFNSNNLALFLALKDPDSLHRTEAFNQLLSAPMTDFTVEGRQFIMKHADELPGSEETIEVLKDSLRNWAANYADSEERKTIYRQIGKRRPRHLRD